MDRNREGRTPMTHEEIKTRLEGCRLPGWEEIPDFGLYMDQLITYIARTFPGISGPLELTSSMINNYVKAGLIDRPTGKKYSREALAQLLMISLMKMTTPLEVMKKLLHPEDGADTRALYESFVRAQRRIREEITSRGSIPALDYALESASLQLALRLLTEGRKETEG